MGFDKEKFIEPFARVAELPAEMIDQNVGAYEPNKPCCVGAHLAGMLSQGFGKPRDYIRGVDEWMRQVGGNRAHATAMLQAAGAGPDPLCGVPWFVSVQDVYEKLCEIEELPSLANANLAGHDMVHADFCGMDLTCVSFENANISFAEFDAACLEGANLNSAEARYTSFKRTNLRKATLRFAHMPLSDFHGAYLNGADLYNAYLHKANLQEADFTDASVKQTVIHLANLDGAMFLNCNIMEAKSIPIHRMNIKQ